MISMRYGIIGSGMMGHEHIRNIALLDGAQVVAVADPDAPMRAEAMRLAGCRGYADHQAMLATESLDALIIAAPNHLHYPLLVELLTTGPNLPILCEKPLGVSLDECRDIARLAEGRAPIWVAMEYRYMPPVQRLIQELRAGVAGAPRMLSIREHRFPFLEKVGDWNRFNANTGGTLVEKCCHFFDLMRLILQDDPVRVYASGAMDVNHLDEQYAGATPDILDNAYVVVDFAKGARAMLDLCMFAEGSAWQEIISVTGPRARIDAMIPGPARFAPDGAERESQVVISDRATKCETVSPIDVDPAILAAGDHHGSTFYQHQRFLDMVRNGGDPDVTVRDGLISVAIGAAAERSAKTGQSVDLTEMF